MIYRGLGILAASFFLTACGGSSSSSNSGSDSSNSQNQQSFAPAEQSIKTVSLVDALNRPLTNADVVFTPIPDPAPAPAPESMAKVSAFAMANVELVSMGNSCSTDLESNASTGQTDDQGELTIDDLAPGTYVVMICKGDEVVTLEFTILDDNATTTAVIAAPVTIDEDTGDMSPLESDSLIIAVSGIIYSNEGVIANAQVALSGGALTNGAMATAITDENGFYSIVINMNANKKDALESAVIQIVAEGYKSLNIVSQDFSLLAAFAGVNIKLTAVGDDSVEVVYEENFEVLYTDATCGEWTSEAIDENVFYDAAMVSDVVESLAPDSLWHTHESGLNIINQAYLANLVVLAPNDQSEGEIPNPVQGSKACWYGRGDADGGIEEGNFLNEYDDEYGDDYEMMPVAVSEMESEEECIECVEIGDLDGGTSDRAHAGALISPVIDFSNENTPLALTFKTWWEIEAVNPNENGFDLMSVEYKIQGNGEGDDEWITLARLNPLTDPVTGDSSENLASMPYSTMGFNQAPLWVKQAPISLDRLAGKVFQLRFSFSTKDSLYNGFRGWLLDDVKISHEVGTFPIWGVEEELSPIET